MSYQYDQYLKRHRENVKRGCDWVFENLPDLVKNVSDLRWQCEFAHDQSKSEADEYSAYDAYFYGGNRSFSVVQEFRKAWLLHIHRHPHHWQHWVLINDDPEEGEILIDMPLNYIFEMICDWWAFSWEKDNLYEIFEWYDKHKKYMKLHPNTREKVEGILSRIKEKLNNDSQIVHHGIKGQKWGVKNGPPYPIDRSGKHDTIVKDAIESGKISKKINREKQMRHTKEGHLPGRSYINGGLEYAKELVDKHSGNGKPITDKHGNWTHKEKFNDSKIIGTHVDVDGVETKTSNGIIAYSKTGTHVYPGKEKK